MIVCTQPKLPKINLLVGATASKRGRPKKVTASLVDRYPTITQLDVNTDEERTATDALHREMEMARPRRDVYLPLMWTTFIARRHYILHNAASVKAILLDYPALKELITVSIICEVYVPESCRLNNVISK